MLLISMNIKIYFMISEHIGCYFISQYFINNGILQFSMHPLKDRRKGVKYGRGVKYGVTPARSKVNSRSDYAVSTHTS